MKALRVRITECAIESGTKGPVAWVRIQLAAGDSFTLPVEVEDAKAVLTAWVDPGPKADLTLTLAKKPSRRT